MNTETLIRQLGEEISARRFSKVGTAAQFDWLIGRCERLAGLLQAAGASSDLVERMRAIASHLSEQARELTHELARQQTLIFQQDAIVFHLMKQGYAKSVAV